MQIKPPQIEEPVTPEVERRMINRTGMLLGFGLVAVLTVVVWLFLWAGGIKEAAEETTPAASQTQQR
jgi:hypothetical protein